MEDPNPWLCPRTAAAPPIPELRDSYGGKQAETTADVGPTPCSVPQSPYPP